MSKYIVTGGAGFIGSHVVELLAREDHEVLVLDNFSTGRKENLAAIENCKRTIVMDCDIRVRPEVLGAFLVYKPDAILHLAAQAAISVSHKDPWEDLTTNIVGTLNLLKAAEQFGIPRFVYASTSAVYGDHVWSPLSEEMQTLPESPYGISKLAGEMYARSATIQTVVLRLGNVYGPRQLPIGENQVIARMLKHLILGDDFSIFGDGEQTRDFVYVEDVARAFKLAAQVEIGSWSRVYNIAGGESHSVNQVSSLVAMLMGCSPDTWKYAPNREDPRRAVRMEIEAARERLRWQPEIGLEDGLRKTVSWWQQYGNQSSHLS